MAGYTTHLAFDLATQIGVILLRKYDQGRPERQRASIELLLALVRARVRAGVRGGAR